jgi:hypothetical protein
MGVSSAVTDVSRGLLGLSGDVHSVSGELRDVTSAVGVQGVTSDVSSVVGGVTVGEGGGGGGVGLVGRKMRGLSSRKRFMNAMSRLLPQQVHTFSCLWSPTDQDEYRKTYVLCIINVIMYVQAPLLPLAQVTPEQLPLTYALFSLVIDLKQSNLPSMLILLSSD